MDVASGKHLDKFLSVFGAHFKSMKTNGPLFHWPQVWLSSRFSKGMQFSRKSLQSLFKRLMWKGNSGKGQIGWWPTRNFVCVFSLYGVKAKTKGSIWWWWWGKDLVEMI